MKMKKTLSLLLASALSLSLLAGCGGAPQTPPAQSNLPAGGSSTSQGDASTPEAPKGPIKVAALASAYEETYPGMWQEVCDAFTAETGIEVELIVDKALEDVIGPSMQGGDFPDVIHLATGRDKKLTEQFIKDKNIADITDVLSMTVPGESAKVSDKIVPGFTDTSITNPYGDGKTYLAPMFYSPAACSITPVSLRKRAGPSPPPGTRCGPWATRPPLRTSPCLLTPPPATSTPSSPPCSTLRAALSSSTRP